MDDHTKNMHVTWRILYTQLNKCTVLNNYIESRAYRPQTPGPREINPELLYVCSG